MSRVITYAAGDIQDRQPIADVCPPYLRPGVRDEPARSSRPRERIGVNYQLTSGLFCSLPEGKRAILSSTLRHITTLTGDSIYPAAIHAAYARKLELRCLHRIHQNSVLVIAGIGSSTAGNCGSRIVGGEAGVTSGRHIRIYRCLSDGSDNQNRYQPRAPRDGWPHGWRRYDTASTRAAVRFGTFDTAPAAVDYDLQPISIIRAKADRGRVPNVRVKNSGLRRL